MYLDTQHCLQPSLRLSENHNFLLQCRPCVGGQKGKNLQMLSRTLVGRVVDFIWGCRTCYAIFLSESDLVAHRQVPVQSCTQYSTSSGSVGQAQVQVHVQIQQLLDIEENVILVGVSFRFWVLPTVLWIQILNIWIRIQKFDPI